MGKAERNSAQNIAGTGREKFGRGGNLHFAVGLARAFGAAIVFSLPLLMTMEMWWLGFYMSPSRLALLLLLVVPLLVGLSHFAGFEETFRWKDNLLNAFVAYAVGFLASAPVLLLFGTISPAHITSRLRHQRPPSRMCRPTSSGITAIPPHLVRHFLTAP